MERQSKEYLIREFVEQPVWAVVGYSENRRKYGALDSARSQAGRLRRLSCQ